MTEATNGEGTAYPGWKAFTQVLSEVRVAQFSDFCVVFCRSLLGLLSLFFWSLYYLSFDWRLLITPLVPPKLSQRWPRIYSVWHSQNPIFLLAWLNKGFFLSTRRMPMVVLFFYFCFSHSRGGEVKYEGWQRKQYFICKRLRIIDWVFVV